MAKQILSIGNPLLDISVSVDKEYLDKYKKVPGTASLASEEDRPMFEEIVGFPDVKYIAGGAAQNTIRGAQWISPTKGITHYIGSIGDDDNGKRLNAAATTDGVQTHYYVSKKTRTGSCAVLLYKKERCLVADLGAANDYQHSHAESEEIKSLLTKIDILYCTGYFLTVSPQTLIQFGEYLSETNKYMVFCVAAPFLIEFFWDTMISVIPFADILVANESEAKLFVAKAGLPKDLKEAVKAIAEMPKANSKRKRTVIITRGSDSILTFNGETGQLQEWPVIPIAKDDIVDVNGAGDAFMGGYIAGLAHNKPFDECIRAGTFSAYQILMASGTQYPPQCTYKWD